MYVYGNDGFLYQANPRRVGTSLNSGAEEVKALEAPYDNPFRYFEAAVHGEITVSPTDLSSLENNLIVVEILTAAKKSSETGRPVKLK
jgi:predicted dehydrogenase